MANGNTAPRRRNQGVALAAALAAGQAQDRQTARPADTAPNQDETVLLELPQQSYVAQKTAEQREVARQKANLQASEKFLYPEGRPQVSEQRPERPERESVKSRRGKQVPAPGKAQGGSGGRRGMLRGKAMIEGAKAAEKSEQLQKEAVAVKAKELADQAEQRYRKLTKNLRFGADMLTAVGSMNLINLVILTLKKNVDLVNKWIVKSPWPRWYAPVEPAKPDEDEFLSGCADITCCTVCIISTFKIILVILLGTIITIAIASIIDDLSYLFEVLVL